MTKLTKAEKEDRKYIDSWCNSFTELEKDHPARSILKLFVEGRIKHVKEQIR